MKPYQKVIFALVLSILTFTVNATFSQEKRIATASRIQGEPPKIDGLLDDHAWQEVEWQNDFIQREPYDGRQPSQRTSFKIIYDNNNIYVAVRGWDTRPDSIFSQLSRRDNGDGDGIGIEFDSYFDHQTAFSFIVLASGVKIDKLITSDGGNEDTSWDAIWDAKTSIDELGWVVEYEIPFNQLRFNNLEEQTWGFQVGRYIYRIDELSLWQPVPRDAPGWVHQYGILKGIEGIKPKRQIEIAPYVLARGETFKKEEGNPFATGKRGHFSGGLDAKIGITNDFTLDLTVNPDFGQVEADPSEVNLSAFESYFAEKRPFFIEGRNLFDFNFSPGDGDGSLENLFYSRRIGRKPRGNPDLVDGEYIKIPETTSIIGAAKITGKTRNGISIGVVEAVTSREEAEIDFNGVRRFEAVEPLTNYFVGSISKEYNEGSTRFSALITSTNRDIQNGELNFMHTNAYSGGINIAHHWNNKNYFLLFKSSFSHVNGSNEAIIRTQSAPNRLFQRPDATHVELDSSRTSLTGHGGLIGIGKGGEGRWRFMSFISWKSPEFELNDVGFVRSVDDIFQVVWVGYSIYEPFSIFRSISINFNQWTGHNFAGERGYWGTNINLNSQFKNFWNGGFGVNYQGVSLSFSALRGGPALIVPGGWNSWVWLNTDVRKKMSVSAEYSESRRTSYSSQNASFSINYKPYNALVISAGPLISNSNSILQFVDNIDFGNEVRYINASIDQFTFALQFRVDYSITPDLSIQYYGRPFFAKGKYFDFKRITNPRADNFSDRFHVFSPAEISYNIDDEEYYIDETGNGVTDYTFSNPNFNFRDFNSNLVIRWEYRPGSTLFLVWSQGRESYESDYNTNFNYSANELWDAHPHNVFLVKLAYRFY
jgi:hypothetical protein